MCNGRRRRFSFFIQKQHHGSRSSGSHLSVATAFLAASSRFSAVTHLMPESLSIFLPSSTLVPSKRTTSGTCSLTSLAAVMMPCAMVSHFMIPPKMLTRIALTEGSLVRILKACVTCAAEAPPPTSRKLAGEPPCSLIMSIVAMARPAPLTMQPMLPSRPM